MNAPEKEKDLNEIFFGEAQTKKKWAKKRSSFLYLMKRENEHFELVFDEVYPMNFELRQGGQGGRPMSVDGLRDSANTRSQRRRNLKGEGYISEHKKFRIGS
ncbi:hypothetical protein Rin_00001580 [Candidatus Regiella insecticola 5.15]|uniref:Uncharacterized protein n=2 Tax=Candidatus Regiella insecticola TaxID=138073 RepID=G2GWM2_9ENTR|nr:hypothetical protein Rin_00001580 [Candidatus Regiella insecticola 5.15]